MVDRCYCAVCPHHRWVLFRIEGAIEGEHGDIGALVFCSRWCLFVWWHDRVHSGAGYQRRHLIGESLNSPIRVTQQISNVPVHSIIQSQHANDLFLFVLEVDQVNGRVLLLDRLNCFVDTHRSLATLGQVFF